jgi:hypothetical protein
VVAAVEGVAAGLLLAIALITTLTGTRTSVVWSKVCPLLRVASAVLLIAADPP